MNLITTKEVFNYEVFRKGTTLAVRGQLPDRTILNGIYQVSDYNGDRIKISQVSTSTARDTVHQYINIKNLSENHIKIKIIENPFNPNNPEVPSVFHLSNESLNMEIFTDPANLEKWIDRGFIIVDEITEESNEDIYKGENADGK